MNNELIDNKENNENKWDFSDYAFTITGIIVAALLVLPEILEAQFGISIFGGSLSDIAPELAEIFESGQDSRWSVNRLRALSPLLFLLTTTITFFKDAFDARKNGGYKGSLFTHTFESLFEDAIYMAITTIMVYFSVLVGAMYISWLTGPITWILFIFIFPIVRKKSTRTTETTFPWLLLLILIAGIIAEVITGVWIAFPLSWLIICGIKLVGIIRVGNHSIDSIFNIIYYAFSVILLAIGIAFDFWMASWAAFPIAAVICWVIKKIRKGEYA